ncbi:MAG: hypothetical protein M1416_02960 [Candidatus Pacearchaeota archaeon]|nr:hypothetical protein [Candidatus Pacearchaeota archaeon]
MKRELSKEKTEKINLIMKDSPNFVNGSPWLSVFPCNPEDVIDNIALLNKTITAAIIASGASVYAYDVIRGDRKIFDTDRHLLQTSGAIILEEKEICKDFPEHHSTEIPEYYKKR